MQSKYLFTDHLIILSIILVLIQHIELYYYFTDLFLYHILFILVINYIIIFFDSSDQIFSKFIKSKII